MEPDPDLQHKYNTNLFLDENTLPSGKIFLVKIQFQNAKKRNKSLPREKATPTMAMPRPLVAGVDTSVMIAVDRDTLPIVKTSFINHQSWAMTRPLVVGVNTSVNTKMTLVAKKDE